jgi:hypothetical protein
MPMSEMSRPKSRHDSGTPSTVFSEDVCRKPRESGKGPKKLVLVGAGILMFLALLGGLLFFRGQRAASVTPEPATDTPPAASPMPPAARFARRGLYDPVPEPGARKISPSGGPALAEWSGVGDAVRPTLWFSVQPEGAGNPWLIATGTTFRKAYMEKLRGR